MASITTKGSYMLRKIASLSVALIVAGSLMVAVPASAATKVSNGVACTKSGATTKVSGKTYKCAKNPLVSSKKLTWLTLECLKVGAATLAEEKKARETKAQFAAQIPVIELGITTETANRTELQTKLADLTVRLAGAQTKLAAAKTDADKKLLTSAVASWTAAIRATESKIRSIDLVIKKLEAAKLSAVNKPVELAADVSYGRENAKIFCTKGL
jgi:hypothetical protein